MKDFINSYNKKICSTPAQSSTISWTTPVNITKAGFAHPYEILVPDQLYRIRGLETIGTNSIHPVCGHCCGSDTLTIYGNTDICGNAHVSGKLTVDGLIDPTGLVLDEQASAPFTAANTSKGLIWIKSEDRGLYYNDSGGNSIRLGGIGPASTSNSVLLIGDQTVLGSKTFTNVIIGNLTGNATTVTKGAQRDASINLLESSSNSNSVLLTGDQTVSGSKTFSNTIIGNLTGNAATVTKGAQRDASINLLDTSVNFLEASSAKYDVSLNLLDTSANIYEASLNLLEVSKVVTDVSVNFLEASSEKHDVSLNLLDTSANIYEASLNLLEVSKVVTDVSVNFLEASSEKHDVSLNALDISKQNTITAGTGLEFSGDTLNAEVTQTELDLKADKTYVDTNLNLKQDTIGNGDLTIAQTNGLQAALNSATGITTEAQTFFGVKTFSDGIVTGKLTSPPGGSYKSWRLIYRMGELNKAAGLYTMGIRFFDENETQIVTGSIDDITANNGQNGAIQWFVSGNQPSPPTIFSTWSVSDKNIAGFIGEAADQRAYFIGLHFSEKQKVSRIEIHSSNAPTLEAQATYSWSGKTVKPGSSAFLNWYIEGSNDASQLGINSDLGGTWEEVVEVDESKLLAVAPSTTTGGFDSFGARKIVISETETLPGSGTIVIEGDITVSGNIAVSGTVDGVDISTLSTTVSGKQDTITAGDGLSLTGATLNAEVTQTELDAKQNTITAGDGLSFTGATLNAEVTQAELNAKQNTITAGTGLSLTGATLNAEVTQAELDALIARIVTLENNTASAIPYEPWNLDITLSEFILQDTWIYYVQFTAPASTKYNEMNLFTTYSSNTKYSGSIGVGIYTDDGGQPGRPTTLVGGGTSSFTLQNMQRRHITISFVTSASVIKNTRYWVAISADNTSGSIFMGYHNDYNASYDVVKYQTKNGYTIGGGMPTTAGANNPIGGGDQSYWFRLSSAISGDEAKKAEDEVVEDTPKG